MIPREQRSTFVPVALTTAVTKLSRRELGQNSWVTYVLPYLGEEAIYNRYKWSVSWDSAENASAVSVKISTLQCPETPHPDRTIVFNEPEGLTAGPTDYIAGMVANGIDVFSLRDSITAELFPAEICEILPTDFYNVPTLRERRQAECLAGGKTRS